MCIKIIGVLCWVVIVKIFGLKVVLEILLIIFVLVWRVCCVIFVLVVLMEMGMFNFCWRVWIIGIVCFNFFFKLIVFVFGWVDWLLMLIMCVFFCIMVLVWWMVVGRELNLFLLLKLFGVVFKIFII